MFVAQLGHPSSRFPRRASIRANSHLSGAAIGDMSKAVRCPPRVLSWNGSADTSGNALFRIEEGQIDDLARNGFTRGGLEFEASARPVAGLIEPDTATFEPRIQG